MNENYLGNKAMLATLTITGFQNSATNDDVTEEVLRRHNVVSNKGGKFVQPLVDDEEAGKVRRAEGALRRMHIKNTLPWDDKGTRLLPSARYFHYRNEFKELEQEFEKARTHFVSIWPSLVLRAKQEQNGLFMPDKYPDVSELAGKFSVKLKLDPMPAMTDDFRATLTDTDREEIESRLKERYEAATQDIWKRLSNVVSKMASTLDDPEKTFRNTLVGNVEDLIEMIPDMNFTSDPDLEKMRVAVKEKLCKHKPAELRDDQQKRAEVAKSADDILAAMSGYIGG
jgi:hypothetical protein